MQNHGYYYQWIIFIVCKWYALLLNSLYKLVHVFIVLMFIIAPTITPDIQGQPTIPVTGSNYNLTCHVAQSLQSSKTYQLKKGRTILRNNTMAIFNFMSLRLSDAGCYTCMVTIESEYLSGSIIALSRTHNVNLTSE